MIINHNISSMNALRNLNLTSSGMDKSMEKLSSGYRINRAADDAAGLAISEKMRAEISGLKVAQRNAQDGISMIQTAEGAMDEIHEMLRRMKDLATQAANSTNTTGTTGSDAAKLQSELSDLASEITAIAERADFNGKALIDGTAVDATFQVGTSNSGEDQIDLALSGIDVTAATLSVDTLDISDQTGAQSALATLDTAIDTVSEHRATLGATQNRLEHTIDSLAVSEENLQSSESRIRDADMAAEMSQLTKYQILQQAGTAMLAQANTKSQSVLSLFG